MRKVGVLLTAPLFLVPAIASAHPGRTNSSGCHNDRKHGGYHCHGGSGYGGRSKRIHTTSRDDPNENRISHPTTSAPPPAPPEPPVFPPASSQPIKAEEINTNPTQQNTIVTKQKPPETTDKEGASCGCCSFAVAGLIMLGFVMTPKGRRRKRSPRSLF